MNLSFKLGKSLSQAWKKLAGQDGQASRAKSPALPEADTGDEEMAMLWHEVEDLLAKPESDGGGLAAVLGLIKSYSGLSGVYLTVLQPGDPKHYYLVCSADDLPDRLMTKLPLTSGLAGWVHTKVKHLPIPRIKADGQLSYVFHKDEPLKSLSCFYGWPLIYRKDMRGALLLAGQRGESLEASKIPLLECLALRLVSHLQQDRLVSRVLELSSLDPQTGLPHRSYFLERLGQLMDVSAVGGQGVRLFVLGISGLGRFAQEHGQEAAKELLRSISGQLLSLARPHWELGHVSYGIFTLAAGLSESEDVAKMVALFERKLLDWPLPNKSGRADLGFFPASAVFPKEAASPEDLLEVTLTALANGVDVEED